MKYLKHLDIYQNALDYAGNLNINGNVNYVISNKENDIVLYTDDCGEYFYIGYDEINSQNYKELASRVINFNNEQTFNLTNPQEFTDYIYILLKNNRHIDQMIDVVSNGIIADPIIVGQFGLYTIYKSVTQIYGNIKIIFS